MVEKRTCDYTGEDIEPGTGIMYVRTDGTILHFVDSKAEKNYLLGREPRDLEWTAEGRRSKGPVQTEAPVEEETGGDEAVEASEDEEAVEEAELEDEAEDVPAGDEAADETDADAEEAEVDADAEEAEVDADAEEAEADAEAEQ